MAQGTRISLVEKFALFADAWAPRTVETLDGHEVKLARLHGDFVWHRHVDADELFLVIAGRFRMEFRDRAVWLEAGEMLVVPAGTEHRPCAPEECQVLLLERAGLRNTGDAPEALRAAARPERI